MGSILLLAVLATPLAPGAPRGADQEPVAPDEFTSPTPPRPAPVILPSSPPPDPGATAPEVPPALDAPPAASAPASRPGATKGKPKAEASFDWKKVPWKLITKIAAGACYATWVVLWTVALPLGGLGALALSGLWRTPQTDNEKLLAASGAVLLGMGGLLGVVGAVAAAAGAGSGAAATVLSVILPEEWAAEGQPTLLVVPRQLFL